MRRQTLNRPTLIALRSASPACLAWPAQADDLLFTSTRDSGTLELYRMAQVGSQIKRATVKPMVAAPIAGSADDKSAAFVCLRQGRHDLYLLDIGAGHVARRASSGLHRLSGPARCATPCGGSGQRQVGRHRRRPGQWPGQVGAMAPGSTYSISQGEGNIYQAKTSGATFSQFGPATNLFTTPAALSFTSFSIAGDDAGSIVNSSPNGGAAQAQARRHPAVDRPAASQRLQAGADDRRQQRCRIPNPRRQRGPSR